MDTKSSEERQAQVATRIIHLQGRLASIAEIFRFVEFERQSVNKQISECYEQMKLLTEGQQEMDIED